MALIGLRPRFTRIVAVAVIVFLCLTLFAWTTPPTHPAKAHIRDTWAGHATQIKGLRKNIKMPWKEPLVVTPDIVPSPHSNDRPNTLGIDPRTAHRYQTDGRVKVNVHGPHPIYELTVRAERDWRAKHAKSSRTLQDAVSEYQKRYGRSPPPGFDLWWDYASMNRVLLPDEYDQIYKDLEPFWGIHPDELPARQLAAEARENTFTIQVRDESADFAATTAVTLSNNSSSSEDFLQRSTVLLNVLQALESVLPDLRATFNALDTPNLLLDRTYRRAAIEAARAGTVLASHGSFSSQGPGIASSCASFSPLAVNSYAPPIPDIPTIWTKTEKSFIHSNHTSAMDVCLNPSYRHIHGFLQSLNYSTPEPLLPIFSTASTSIHGDIHIPSFLPFEDESLSSIPTALTWDRKLYSKLYWRGETTGTFHSPNSFWNITHRVRLVEAANERKGDIWVMPSTTSRLEPVGAGERVERALINEEWVDVKFSGKPVQCDTAPGSTCMLLEKMFPFDQGPIVAQQVERKRKRPVDESQWKYLMDIDGNGPSPRFGRLLTSNSLIFKSTIFTEWYTDRIQPWLHYVPVKPDFSDLYDIIAFFKGDIDGAGQDHDAMADVLARAGHKWQLTMSREEDLLAYVFRLLLEYARVMSPDRETLNFEL